jgi:hypothetical protein
MKRLLDELIGYVWPVVIAGVDVVHSRGQGLSQNSDRAGDIARRTPNQLVGIPPGELHGPIAQTVYGDRSVGKGKCTAKIRMFRHLPPLKLPKQR